MAPARFVEVTLTCWKATLVRWSDEERNYTLSIIWCGLGALLLFLGSGALRLWDEESNSVLVTVAARIGRVCWLLALIGFLAVVGLAWRQRRGGS